MKKHCLVFTVLCLSAMAFFSACNQKYPGYKQSSNGLYYKFYKKDRSAVHPKKTDFLMVKMACYLNDTLYYDWSETNGMVHVQLSEPHFKGDLQSAYAMMGVGDSASFYIKADSIAVHYYNISPDSVGLKADDFFRYEVKLLDAQTEREFKETIERMKREKMDASKLALKQYVTENKIDVEPLGSGIYIIQMEPGKGDCPEQGDQVEVDFEVSLLNGESVGTTYGTEDKFVFVLGEGTTIDGWEEIMPQMHLGERVKAIIPCEMAYGEHAIPLIPAYSNLIYDIKLLKITKADELKRQAELEIKKKRAESEQAFRAYLKENRIVDHTESGLYYAKSVTTEGESPVPGSTTRITFDAKYIDGTPLGTSEQLGGSYTVVYGSGSVLKGLEEGIGLMKVGEKARFVLPYNLAYGEVPYGNIPAFSNLVFDVELLEIVKENDN